jgi:adenylyltransferase/sulfurtransferase
MKEIESKELKSLMESGEPYQLIDVREPNEYDFANIGGELIPLATIPSNIEKIDPEKKIVVMCRSGKRSASIVNYLKENHGIEAYNLRGGILAYSDEVDPSLPKY